MIDIETLIEKLKDSCNNNLPGEVAQNKMLPVPHADSFLTKSEEHAIPSAVLILLYPHKNNIFFILTERTNEVQHHKGQISLPGGSWENGEQLHETALRETEEEIGVSTIETKTICELTPLFVNVTGYMIHPFVAYVTQKPNIAPHPSEVNNVFTVSVTELINPLNRLTELWTIRKTLVDVPFFKFGKYKVWGATAMILSEFQHCIKEII
ncbi:MAG: NUDIX domain-containing protein [Planctomycetia bacterium]|nr:NUDIX domain-containing protein [Planctomycetia bacterium]